MSQFTDPSQLARLAQGFVRQENFLWSRPGREARLSNMGSEDQDLWVDVMSEFIGCTPTSDELLLVILPLYEFDRLDVFGQAYLQPWIEKASADQLEWMAQLVKTDERARRAIEGVFVPATAHAESSLWALIPRRPGTRSSKQD